MSTMIFKITLILFVSLLFGQNNGQSFIRWLPLVDDPSQPNFLTQFVCVYKDINGYGTAFLGGGYYANNNGNNPKAIRFEDGVETGAIGLNTIVRRSFNTSGTHWAYLYDQTLQTNVDFVQIEIVSMNYTGDCGTLQLFDANSYPLPPTGWQSGFPPAYTPSSN